MTPVRRFGSGFGNRKRLLWYPDALLQVKVGDDPIVAVEMGSGLNGRVVWEHDESDARRSGKMTMNESVSKIRI
jgi:hypothetical protein